MTGLRSKMIPLALAACSAPGHSPTTPCTGKCDGSSPDGGASVDSSIDAALDGGTLTLPGATCTRGGFCWTNPTPQGNNFTSVLALASSDVWFAGGGHMVLHYDGTAWTSRDAGLTDTPYQLASLGGEVWVASYSGVHRWNGSSWDVPAGSPAAPITSLAGTSSELFATGQHGLYRAAAGVWTPTGVNGYAQAVWSPGAGEAWGVGSFSTGQTGAMWHFTSGAWTQAGSAPEPLATIWGASASDVWAAGGTTLAHWDGTTWRTQTAPCSAVEHLAGTSASDVWASCYQGALLHWNGSSWTQVAPTSPDDTSAPAWAIGAASATDIWAAGPAGRLVHGNGATWTELDTAAARTWIQSIDRGWAAGFRNTVLRFDGQAWSRVTTPNQPATDFYSAWAPAANDVWIGGSGVLLHFDGNAWTQTSFGSDTVTAMANGFLATYGGAISHYNAGAWTALPNPPRGGVHGVWAASATDAWIAGDRGSDGMATLCHYTGTWSCVTTIANDLYGVWGSASNDVYAAGNAGVWHYDGSTWTRITAITDSFTVAGGGANDVYVVGSSSISHFDGTAWTQIDSGIGQTIFTLTVQASGTWIGGSGGAIAVHP